MSLPDVYPENTLNVASFSILDLAVSEVCLPAR
jgi:hypothetical protein